MLTALALCPNQDPGGSPIRQRPAILAKVIIAAVLLKNTSAVLPCTAML